MANYSIAIAFLILINIILALVTGYNFYRMIEFRKTIERLIPAFACLLLAIRYLWIFWFYVTDFYNDLIVRGITVMVSVIFFMSMVWLEHVFPLDNSTIHGKFTNLLFYLVLAFIAITGFLGAILPSDPVRRDINLSILYLFIMANVLIIFETLLRVGSYWRSISRESKLYFSLLTLGVGLISIGDVFFYFAQEWMLRQIAPTIGFLFVIFADFGAVLIPFITFINKSDLSLAIISSDYKLINCNRNFKNYINPKFLTKKEPIAITDIWSEKVNTLLPALNRLLKERQLAQINDRFFNYKTNETEFITINLYPLVERNSNISVGMFLVKSDELQYLKQRKDFLFDILTHDIANVDQILQLTLESFKREDFTHDQGWEKIAFAFKQTDRLQQLIFSVHNLFIIDKYSIEPSENVLDFNQRLIDLIQAKNKLYDQVEIRTKDLEQLKPVRTTGNLRAAFSLLLDAVLETCEGEILISAVIDDGQNSIQSIIIEFNTQEIHPDLLQVYSNENKSELVSQSSVRVNLIVAAAIIEKNKGNIVIKERSEKRLKTEIIIEIPYMRTLEKINVENNSNTKN